MKQGCNPYLPSYEYVPDGEPRLFDGRVYVYGSHDRFGGLSFCLNDYVTYSAPADDLTSWTYEGIIYKKEQDPKYKKGLLNVFFAPDCVRGTDENYYLYYTLGFNGYIGVATSSSPKGPFQFLSHVKYDDGTLLGDKKEPLQFDPGVLVDDDGKVYLYSGFGTKGSFGLHGRKPATEGAMVMRLKDDMCTIDSDIKFIAKTIHNSKGTDFEGHEFFEASSIRKYDGIYYYIYSSYKGHELCYATSEYPDRDFKFGGVLISNGDIGISDKPTNFIGNNHGSLLYLNGDYYIFHHRQTNGNSFARQACAEKIEYKDHHFKQAEMTSQGLNLKPLVDEGYYPSYIACQLYSTRGVYFYRAFKKRRKYYPYFTQNGKDRESGEDQFIRNFSSYAIAGFKYFDLKEANKLSVSVKGNAVGEVCVYLDDNKLLTKIKIDKAKKKTEFESPVFTSPNKVSSLYFRFNGKGHFDFFGFKFIKE